MHVRRNFLNWGVFLICLGAVPLAVQMGALDRTAAAELLRLWPLILVGIGIGLLLRFSRFEVLGGVLAAGTFGMLVGVVLAGGIPGAAAACNSAQVTGSPTNRTGNFSTPAASLTLELTCAEIDLARMPGQSWSVEVTGTTSEPTIDADAAALRLRSPSGSRFNPFGGDRRERWSVTLPTEPSLSANMTLNATTAQLALGNGPLTSVNATFNASDATLDLGGATPGSPGSIGGALNALNATANASTVRLTLPSTSLAASLTLNAATLELCAPDVSGLQIIYEDTLSSHNFAAAGLVQTAGTWRSTDYDTAATRLDVRVTANVSSITLSRAGVCE